MNNLLRLELGSSEKQNRQKGRRRTWSDYICSHIRKVPRGICRSAYKEPVEGLVSLVGLVVLESVSELCEERPVGVGVFCAVSREEEGRSLEKI